MKTLSILIPVWLVWALLSPIAQFGMTDEALGMIIIRSALVGVSAVLLYLVLLVIKDVNNRIAK